MKGFGQEGVLDVSRSDSIELLSTPQAAFLKAAAALASRWRGPSSYLILIFHRVLPEPDPLLPGEPCRQMFATQLDLISRLFNVMPLSEAVARSRSGGLPARAACITFDDGYANNLEVAAPLLAERRLPATIFIATDFLGGGNMWNDMVIESVRRAPQELDLTDMGFPVFRLDQIESRRAAIGTLLDSLKYLAPSDRFSRVHAIAERTGASSLERLMMNEDEVRRLSGWGIDVGAHTRTHPILTRLNDDDSREEIAGSKHVLQSITGSRIAGFAYPNGRPLRDYERRHVDLVRNAGFDYSVSTAWGSASARSEVHQLPRVAAWDKTPVRYAARLIRAYTQGSAAIA